MTNQSQYDELWSDREKLQKIKEIIKQKNFLYKKVTPEQAFEALKEITVYDVCEELCEMNDFICAIWEVINHVER